MQQTLLSSSRRNISVTLILILVSAPIVFYIVYRAAVLSLTIDEAVTWFNFVRPQKNIPAYSPEWLANHHLLNSWLMRITTAVFGESEFAMRLPNVCGGIVYLGYSFALAKNQKPLTALLLFISLTAHPWLLQYFSLARGYGLSFAGIIAGLYYAWQFWNGDKHWRNQLYSGIAFLLAVLANLNVAFFILPFLGVTFCLIIFSPLRKNKTIFFVALGNIIAVFLLTWLHGKWLVKSHALTHGTNDGFWNGTVSSIIHFSQGRVSWALNTLAAVKMFFIVSAATVLLILIIQLIRYREIRFGGMIAIAFAGTILIYFLLHQLNGIYYPLERTGLFLLPVFMCGLILSCSGLNGYWKYVLYVFALILIPALLINFCMHANLSHTYEWAEHQDMKKLCHDLNNLDPKGEKIVGMNWLLTGSFQYYNTIIKLPVQGAGGAYIGELNNDFAITIKSDRDLHYLDLRFWELYHAYANGLYLYRRRKNPEPPNRVVSRTFNFDPGESPASQQAKSDINKNYFLSLDGPSAWSFPITLSSPDSPDTANPVVASIQFLYRTHEAKVNAGFFISKPGVDSGSVCHSLSAPLSNQKTGEWRTYSTTIYLRGNFPASHPLRIQFVNDGDAPFDIDKLSVSFGFYERNFKWNRL